MIKQAIAKNKLVRILSGWKNYVFEDVEIEKMAKQRAQQCAHCPQAKPSTYAAIINDEMKDIEGMVCNGCGGPIKCPLSTKLRSKEETCPLGNW